MGPNPKCGHGAFHADVKVDMMKAFHGVGMVCIDVCMDWTASICCIILVGNRCIPIVLSMSFFVSFDYLCREDGGCLLQYELLLDYKRH